VRKNSRDFAVDERQRGLGKKKVGREGMEIEIKLCRPRELKLAHARASAAAVVPEAQCAVIGADLLKP